LTIDFDDEGAQSVESTKCDSKNRGSNQVAQIITYGTMAAKSGKSVDIGTSAEFTLAEAGRLANLVPRHQISEHYLPCRETELPSFPQNSKGQGEDGSPKQTSNPNLKRQDELSQNINQANDAEGFGSKSKVSSLPE